MKEIYIVEDDENIQELIIYALTSANFNVIGFSSSKEFYLKLNDSKPDLIILDIMLPGEDGISILKNLKSNIQTQDIPIIMLTAKSSELDKITGLDLGADDYITKPFSVLELISRIKAVLRRSSKDDLSVLKVNNIYLDKNTRIVTSNNTTIDLTFKEFELLEYLIINKNIVLNRSDLLTNIWGYDFAGETRTVDMHIASLRQKLASEGKNIITIRNIGYKLEEVYEEKD